MSAKEAPLSRAELLNSLLMALLYEEEAVLRDYKGWMARVEHEEVREFLAEQVQEAAHHKGEILNILETIEMEDIGALRAKGVRI